MNDVDKSIIKMAIFLTDNSEVMTFKELAEFLNKRHQSGYSTTYGRGVASLLSALYNRISNDVKEDLDKAGLTKRHSIEDLKDVVALAYVGKNNKHAWEAEE